METISPRFIEYGKFIETKKGWKTVNLVGCFVTASPVIGSIENAVIAHEVIVSGTVAVITEFVWLKEKIDFTKAITDSRLIILLDIKIETRKKPSFEKRFAYFDMFLFHTINLQLIVEKRLLWVTLRNSAERNDTFRTLKKYFS